MADLPDDAIVCRGGRCTADRFSAGSGVTLDERGLLCGVSVNSAAGLSLADLSRTIPNRQVGMTTVGMVRELDGTVEKAPTRNNPHHCVLSGIDPQMAEKAFTPTVANPNLEV